MIVSIDPGVRGCGVAAWHNTGELLRAAYVPGGSPDNEFIGTTVRNAAWAVEEWISSTDLVMDRLIIERPQTYRGRSKVGDTNDLLDLSLVVGALSLLSACPLMLVRPSMWKGQTPKSATQERARVKLGDLVARVDISCGKSLSPNVWDAVGIGLWYLRKVNNTVDKVDPVAHV